MDRRIPTLIVTSLGSLMAQLDVTIVNVALPTLQRDLHAGFGSLQWVVNAYTIPLAALLLTAGRLSDVYGRKKLFVLGLAIFTAGSAICALTDLLTHLGIPQLATLLFGRVIQGSGSAILVPGSLAIVNEAYYGDEAQRAAAVGGRGAMVGLGLALGPLVGGALLVRFDWTSIFLINIPIGIAAIVLASRAIDESCDPKAPKHLDLFGLVTMTGAVVAIVLALILVDANGGTIGVANVALLAGGLALGAIFVAEELRIREPLYDLGLFKNRSFTGAGASVFLLSAAILGFLFFLTLYLQNVLGFAPLETGIALLPLTATVLLVSPVSGRAMASVGPRTLVTAGLLAAAFGSALLCALPAAATRPDWPVLIPAFFLVGLGMGLANPAIVAVATGTVEHERSGLAAGLNAVCRQIGTAFGVALIGAFLTWSFNRTLTGELPAPRAQQVLQAGTVAASAALRTPSPQTQALQKAPDFTRTGRLAQVAWVAAFRVGAGVAAILLFAGAGVAFATIRASDLVAKRAARASRVA